jgi:spore coat polysaccharide biosynthesis protein SpsF
MKTAVILQARMSSSRLPGKVLMNAAGHSVLDWVVRSVSKIEHVNVVCVAVPYGMVNDAVANEAARLGAVVARGPEDDVLERFRIAASQVDADEIIRVTTDCPLSDPSLCSAVVNTRRSSGADYCCNNLPPSYPHGLDCEVMTRDALERAAASATDLYDREHVTPWIRRDASVTRVLVNDGPGGELTKWRWTIDTLRDFVFFEAVATRLSGNIDNWHAVKALLDNEPALHDINFQDRQR